MRRINIRDRFIVMGETDSSLENIIRKMYVCRLENIIVIFGQRRAVHLK
jgi:hypothetical protein